MTKIIDLLNDRTKSLRGSKILALGVAYKRDVDDVRESPSLDVMTLLLAKGADISFSDPFVATVRVADRALSAVELTPAVVKSADVVVMLTDHSRFDREMIAANASLISTRATHSRRSFREHRQNLSRDGMGTERIRVGLVIGQLSYGGAEGQLFELARALRERHEPVVYCLSDRVHPYGPALERWA